MHPISISQSPLAVAQSVVSNGSALLALTNPDAELSATGRSIMYAAMTWHHLSGELSTSVGAEVRTGTESCFRQLSTYENIEHARDKLHSAGMAIESYFAEHPKELAYFSALLGNPSDEFKTKLQLTKTFAETLFIKTGNWYMLYQERSARDRAVPVAAQDRVAAFINEDSNRYNFSGSPQVEAERIVAGAIGCFEDAFLYPQRIALVPFAKNFLQREQALQLADIWLEGLKTALADNYELTREAIIAADWSRVHGDFNDAMRTCMPVDETAREKVFNEAMRNFTMLMGFRIKRGSW